MDTNQYIEMFLDESQEHLQAVNDNLLKLENQPQELAIVEEIFRSAHTLKGMAATMEYTDIASLTHQMENVLDLIRKSEMAVTTEIIDINMEAIEVLEEMISDISNGGNGQKDVTALIEKLKSSETGDAFHEPESVDLSSSISPEALIMDQYQSTVIAQAEEQGFRAYQLTIRLSESCMLKAARVYMVFDNLEQIGEIIKTVPGTEELEAEQFGSEFFFLLLTQKELEEVRNNILSVAEVESVEVYHYQQGQEPTTVESEEQTSPPAAEERKNASSKTIRVNIERIDRLMNLFEEMVIDRGRLEDLSKAVGNRDLTEAVERMSRVSKDMQSMMLTMRMVPIEQVFNRFPRMVRGLAKDLNKEIHLDITGAHTELDRTVIDEIGDPLVHLIRNSIDHGIETPAIRQEKGKKEAGILALRAFHSGNHVYIEIEDDGNGISREKVIAKALANELITKQKAEQLTDAEVHNLIFASGFSTAEEVSDISGRGVGLDVVRNKIEALGGHVFVESEQGKGSIFSIKLPLTLSILSTLLVKVAEETYSVPLSFVEETALLKEEQVMEMQGRQVMDFRGKVIPLVSLCEVFDINAKDKPEKDSRAVVIVKKGDKATGLIVDSFLGQKEVVLKSLGNYLQDIYAISGATILGNGRVALIIDPGVLIH